MAFATGCTQPAARPMSAGAAGTTPGYTQNSSSDTHASLGIPRDPTGLNASPGIPRDPVASCPTGPSASPWSRRPCLKAFLLALLVPLAAAGVWTQGWGGQSALAGGPGLALRLQQGRTRTHTHTHTQSHTRSHTQGHTPTYKGRRLAEVLGALEGRPHTPERRRLEGEESFPSPLQEGGGGGKEEEEALLCPEDKELFARAAATGPASSTPPRVAFLFLVRGPLPLAPLWAKFFEGRNQDQFSVYLHTEEGFQYSDKDTPEVFRGRQIPSKVSTGVRTMTGFDTVTGLYSDRACYGALAMTEPGVGVSAG